MEHKRKITARTMGIQKFKEGQSFTLIGRVRRYETGQTDYGPFVKFRGMFEAVNETTGEQAASSVAIFPGGLLEDSLIEAIETANKDGGGASVDIAIRFSMVADETSPVGYRWSAEQLVEQRDTDPLADLRSKVALPAPEASEASEEASEASKGKGRSSKAS